MERLSVAPRKDQHTGTSLPEGRLPSISPAYGAPKPETDSLILFRQFLRRSRQLVVVSTILGTIAALAVSLLEPTLYQARAKLEIQDFNDTFLNIKQFMPINESDGPTNTYGDIQTQIKILQSDRLLNSVAARMPAAEHNEIDALRPMIPWPVNLFIHESGNPEFVQQETKRMIKNFKVRAVGQTRVVELTAESRNPRLAADFINQVSATYVERNIKSRYEIGQNISDSLSRLLDTERVKMRQSEDALQKYAKESGLLLTSSNKNMAEERLSQIQDALSKAQENRIAAQSRYETATQSSLTGVADGQAASSIRDYQAKMAQLRQQRADLAAIYTPDYYKLKRLDAQIEALESAMNQEKRQTLNEIETRYREAMHRETLLASSYANQSAVVSDLAGRAVQYNVLEREVEGNRQSYNEMLKQVKQATVAAAIRADNVQVVDEAVPPLVPHSPKRLLYSALGLLMGSSFGLLFAYIRERADSSLREPGEGVQYLGVAELGCVVHVRTPERGSRGLIPERNASDEPYRVTESYRAIVTSLLSQTNGRDCPLLLVTSPGPGEGKTTVTANLGLMLAAIGRRVLLVDGDLRKPRLDKMFSLKNDRGLTMLIADRSDAARAAEAVQKTSRAGLSILTSGPAVPGCADLLHSPELPRLMSRLKKEFDFVLIDTPPVLPVADARVIGSFADGAVLVARARRTTRDAAEAARYLLVADGIPILGMILNDWDPSSNSYPYYAAYKYQPAHTDGS